LSFFRSVVAVAVADENGNAGNVFFQIHRDEVTRTLIGCPPTAERQKIGFDPIATERQLPAGGSGNGATDFFHASNVILTALT